jgi:anti-sigma B factor antagonist
VALSGEGDHAGECRYRGQAAGTSPGSVLYPGKIPGMGAAEQLRIEVRHGPGRVVVGLAGELDMASAEMFEQALAAEDLEREPMIVLDLQRLDFIDSTGLRVVLAALDRCRERGQEFAITPGSQQVQRLLRITGVAEHLPTIAATGDVTT